MSSYALEYTDDADNQLADLWLASFNEETHQVTLTDFDQG